MNTTTIAGIRFDLETARTLEQAGADNAESVTADLERVRGGDAAGLLAHCLDGAEDAATIAGWRDYVSTLCAEAGVSMADVLTAETITEEQIRALRNEADVAGDLYTVHLCGLALAAHETAHDDGQGLVGPDGEIWTRTEARANLAGCINSARAMED